MSLILVLTVERSAYCSTCVYQLSSHHSLALSAPCSLSGNNGQRQTECKRICSGCLGLAKAAEGPGHGTAWLRPLGDTIFLRWAALGLDVNVERSLCHCETVQRLHACSSFISQNERMSESEIWTPYPFHSVSAFSPTRRYSSGKRWKFGKKNSLSGKSWTVLRGRCCNPHLTDHKLRIREVKLLAQGHTAGK